MSSSLYFRAGWQLSPLNDLMKPIERKLRVAIVVEDQGFKVGPRRMAFSALFAELASVNVDVARIALRIQSGIFDRFSALLRGTELRR